jgi:hypothetical protein
MMSEMRRAAVALLLCFLAACSSNSPEPPIGPAPGSISARFPTGGAVDVIQVTVSDRMAARDIELVGPDGVVQPAYNVETQQATQVDPGYRGWGLGPSVGLGVGGGSGGFGTGIGLSFPLGVYGAPTSTTTTDQTVTNAFIRIPDLGDYRQNWQDFKIRMRMGEPPDIRFLTIDAPPPAG